VLRAICWQRLSAGAYGSTTDLSRWFQKPGPPQGRSAGASAANAVQVVQNLFRRDEIGGAEPLNEAIVDRLK
jgi:hypothetical protein